MRRGGRLTVSFASSFLYFGTLSVLTIVYETYAPLVVCHKYQV